MFPGYLWFKLNYEARLSPDDGPPDHLRHGLCLRVWKLGDLTQRIEYASVEAPWRRLTSGLFAVGWLPERRN